MRIGHDLHRFLQRLVLVAVKIRDGLSIALPIVSGRGAASTTGTAAVAVAATAATATGAGAGSGFSTILGIGRIHCEPEGKGNGLVSEHLGCSI